jgi:hypothetical protein
MMTCLVEGGIIHDDEVALHHYLPSEPEAKKGGKIHHQLSENVESGL